MYRQLPNQLTILRLVLAGVFFVTLNQYRFSRPEAVTESIPHDLWLWLAVSLFVLAALTDALDGYLARRWAVESTFGRIMDPFCDKVLIIGAFIYLAGPRFVMPDRVQAGDFFNMVSGVYPWMVAVILARELLVTGVRGQFEGQGVSFGANVFGKLKMILQSVAVPVILGIVALNPTRSVLLAILRDLMVYATIIVTVFSGLPYLAQASAVMRRAGRDR